MHFSTVIYSARSSLRKLVSDMRQLAGTRTRYRRAYAAPLAGLSFGAAEYRLAEKKHLEHSGIRFVPDDQMPPGVCPDTPNL